MRRIWYCAAMSLDGYVAGPNGEYDWIIDDPEIDMAEGFKQFDTILTGRGTFELMVRENRAEVPGMDVIVFSRTLRQSEYPQATIVADKQKEAIETLRTKPGKEILLWGGKLFRSFLESGFVDVLDIAVIPVLLGNGIPMLLPPTGQKKLQLTSQRSYKSGIVALQYSVK